MHSSRFCGLIIDCQTEDLDSAASFWGRALGYETKPSSDVADEDYVLLQTGPDDPHMEVQKVSHPSRVHLDIETDNVEAEVERLEKLGATRVKQVRDWWVMQAPTGHRFCVVVAVSASFKQRANHWD